MTNQYTANPVMVKAMQLTDDNAQEIHEAFPDDTNPIDINGTIAIVALLADDHEPYMQVGQWIVEVEGGGILLLEEADFNLLFGDQGTSTPHADRRPTKADDTRRMLDAVVAAKSALLYRLRSELKAFDGLDDEEQEAVLINLANKDFDNFKSTLEHEHYYVIERHTRAWRGIIDDKGWLG